jgi:hypothetical protein
VSVGVTSACFGSDWWACPHCIFCNLMLQLAQGPLHQEALGATLCAADHSHAKIFKTRNPADAAGSVTWSTPAFQPSHHILVWQQPMQKPVRPPVHHSHSLSSALGDELLDVSHNNHALSLITEMPAWQQSPSIHDTWPAPQLVMLMPTAPLQGQHATLSTIGKTPA